MRTTDGVSEDFQVKTGVRQGCVLSPLLFNCVMNRILREATEMLGGGLNIKYALSCWWTLPLLPEQDHSLHLHSKSAFKMCCIQMTLPWLLRPGEEKARWNSVAMD